MWNLGGYQSWVLPSGPSSRGGNFYQASAFTAFWTDQPLSIDDFRAVATGTLPAETPPQPFDLNVHIVAAPDIASLNAVSGTEIATIVLSVTPLSSPVSGIATTVPVTIPAGSYVSIRINTTTSVFSLDVAWSLRYSEL